jgi:hypothetical protein
MAGWVAGAAVFLALGACQTQEDGDSLELTLTIDPSLIDQSLLTGTPCSPPCWYGLQPGKSTEAQARSRLKDISFVDPASIVTSESSWVDGRVASFVTFGCRSPVSRHCGTLTLVEGVLVEIGIPILYEVTFSQTVPLLGQPDHFFVQPVSVERTDCVAGLVWKDRSVLLMTDTLIGEECDTLREAGSLTAQSTVSGAIYGEEGTVPPHGGEDTPWQGFSPP